MRQTAKERFRILRVGMMIVLAGIAPLVISVGCSSDQNGEGGSGSSSKLSNSAELLDRRYTYLLRGDDGFPTITSGYRIKTTPDDGISSIALVPDPEWPVDGDDSCQTFTISLRKASKVMVVVADSIGSGMVTFEYGELQPGDYTLFTGDFPQEMERFTKDCKRLVIYLTVGKFIRHRARWSVSEHGRLVHKLNF